MVYTVAGISKTDWLLPAAWTSGPMWREMMVSDAGSFRSMVESRRRSAGGPALDVVTGMKAQASSVSDSSR
jgi:hypothetical protein